MVAALLLLSLLNAQPVTHADAAALAAAGRHEAALDAYRRLAAADPADHAARMAIARLHVAMGDHELAEPVFRSVMLENPANVEAMLGAGLALVALDRPAAALETLARAEALAPQDPAVLDALGRAHAQAGDLSRAVRYAERAAALRPTPAVRAAYEQARVRHGHRVEVSAFGERYDTATPETGSVDLRLDLRLHERLRLLGRGQHQHKFRFDEQRGGGGLAWRAGPRTWITGQVLAAADTVVLPRWDALGAIAHSRGEAELSAGYRFFRFAHVDLSVLSPGATWQATDRVALTGRYYLLLTDRRRPGGIEEDHAAAASGAVRVARRVALQTGYAYGTEDFDTLSPDRVGRFDAHTVSAGVRLDLPTFTSVVGRYEHQWRPERIEMHRVTLAIVQAF